MRMQERTCPLCRRGSVDVWLEQKFDPARLDRFAFASRKLPELMRFPLALCGSCDLVFAQRIPDSEWISAGYREAAFDAGIESVFAAEAYAAELSRLLPISAPQRSALDIGAGDGAFLAQLLKLGYSNVVGVEPSMEPVTRAAPEIQPLLRNEFFDPEKFPPESFDLVTCFQTLEHVEAPLDLCRSAYRLLRPGGLLLVADHDFRAWPARLLGERSPIYDLEHLQLFSRRSLTYLYATAGFGDVVVRPLRNTYPLSYWAKLMPLPVRFKRVLLNRLTGSHIGQWRLSGRMGNLIAFGTRK
ncbi:MAG: class I SAM-dependent methyltransferase [Rhodocyclales bacterium]|nr:class I SAM-dependent methyltransferase [Rhodocyclales bacterium]